MVAGPGACSAEPAEAPPSACSAEACSEEADSEEAVAEQACLSACSAEDETLAVPASPAESSAALHSEDALH
jgi:hypothetical protein